MSIPIEVGTEPQIAALDLGPNHRLPQCDEDKLYPILRAALQENTATDLDSVKEQIFEILPLEDPSSDMAWRLNTLIAELAHAIPPEHESASRLLHLLITIRSDSRWLDWPAANGCDYTSVAVREQLDSEQSELDDEDGDADTATDDKKTTSITEFQRDLHFRNYHAFAARLKVQLAPQEKRVDWWCLWCMECAHEGGHERLETKVRDAWPLAAAEWIFHYGQKLYHHAITNGEDMDAYKGPLWAAQAAKLRSLDVRESEMGIHRWEFWKERFRTLAKSERDHEYRFSDFTKQKAAEAVVAMDDAEKTLSKITIRA